MSYLRSQRIFWHPKIQSFSERRSIERRSERALIVSERERRSETDLWAPA